MENGEARAEFWRKFILENCQYPAPSRLRRQFEGARFFDFCDCGCNTFRVEPTSSATSPLASLTQDLPEGPGASIYEADFELIDGKTLEIIIFADQDGNLSEVEVDCCANSYPVPHEIEVTGPPFHTRAADGLFADISSA
jgi:hypothetical protein